MNRFYSVLLCFIITTTVFSQSGTPSELVTPSDLDQKYTDYYKLKNETIYTHLNKSNVLRNENLWLKSYIYYNKDAVPYSSTTMVFYNVYDEIGSLIDQKVFHAKDGFVSGQIKIDDKYEAGVYHLKSTTNWMRNFNIDNSDFKTFVVNSESNIVEDFKTNELKIIPEGGQLIANTVNTIGVKIDAKPSDYKNFKGVVKNETGNIICFFSFNRFGLSKFNVQLNSNENLTVTILNKEEELFSKKINDIKTEGLNLSVKNAKDKFLLTLRTNKRTIVKLADKSYKLYYHRDGEINYIDINFKKGVLQYTVGFLKSELLSGINILTLFDENNKPVLERMLFNEANIKIGYIEDDVRVLKQKDSSIISLKTNLKPSVSNNFSVSVLPEFSKSYNFSDNIITKILLSPYLKSPMSSYQGYLESIDNKSLYNLDLLLIIEGNSKQSWNDIIYKPQRVKYQFDTGFLIKGKLNKEPFKKPESIELISPINAIAIKSKLLDDNFFEFSGLYLNKDSSINFVLRDKKGNSLKAYPYYNFYPKPITDSLSINTTPFEIPEQIVKEIPNIQNFVIDDDAIELGEVELETIKKKKKPKNRPQGLNASNLVEIPDKEHNAQLVIDFIGQNGFDVSISGGTVSILSRRGRSFTGRFSPQVFLDHANITSTLELISTMRLNQVEEIFISRSGAGLGSNGAGGAISIFSRSGTGGFSKKGRYKTFEMDFGFNSKEQFKSPHYQSVYSDFFQLYGIINWNPSIEADNNGTINFKLPNTYNGRVILYINGMDENGKLYHFVKKVTLK